MFPNERKQVHADLSQSTSTCLKVRAQQWQVALDVLCKWQEHCQVTTEVLSGPPFVAAPGSLVVCDIMRQNTHRRPKSCQVLQQLHSCLPRRGAESGPNVLFNAKFLFRKGRQTLHAAIFESEQSFPVTDRKLQRRNLQHPCGTSQRGQYVFLFKI